MQRNAPCLWLLTCVFVFTCTRRSAATNASNTGTIDSPCTACVLTAYDGRALYVYASTEASVQAYDVHYLQITLEGIHPTAGGAPHELQSFDYGPPPVTTFIMGKSDKCLVLWYWSGADASMPGGRVYVMPKDGSSCPNAMYPTPAPNASTTALETSSTPAAVANTSNASTTQNTSTVAAPLPPVATTSNVSTAHNTSTALASLPPATTPASLPTPVYNITYNQTIPNTHCHPAGDSISGITLEECGDRCTDVHCSAFSFHTDLIFTNVTLSNMSLVTNNCYICGFPTYVEKNTTIVDGKHSPVLAPALLREHQSPYDMFNIYQPVYTEVAPAPTECDASGVQQWLERAIFAPVLAEASASAGGALNATREGELLALLAASVAANLSHAAKDCSMPEVNTLALLDQARVALRAAGVTTGPCAAFSGALLELALAPALAELNASTRSVLNATHAGALRLLLEQQFLPALLANGSTCDPAQVPNATIEAQAHAFAHELLQTPMLAGLFGAVVQAADVCAQLFEVLAAGSTNSMLEELNATAGGALHATHAAAMTELVQQHLVAPLASSAANCTDLPALFAAMQPRALQLQLALAQHPLFRAYYALSADAEVVVEMTVQLGMSLVEFDAAAQRNFRTGIASACSVAVEAVRIAAVREAGAGRRRLLQAGTQQKLEVDTQIDAALAQALAVLAAAENSTAVQESVQARMGRDVPVETVGRPTLAQPRAPAPSPAPSPPRANYVGQHSAKSTDEGSWSIFVVALLLLLVAFIVVFASALCLWRWGERASALVPGDCPQPPGYPCAQLGFAQNAAPEQQNLLAQAVMSCPYEQSAYAYTPAYPLAYAPAYPAAPGVLGSDSFA